MQKGDWPPPFSARERLNVHVKVAKCERFSAPNSKTWHSLKCERLGDIQRRATAATKTTTKTTTTSAKNDSAI